MKTCSKLPQTEAYDGIIDSDCNGVSDENEKKEDGKPLCDCNVIKESIF